MRHKYLGRTLVLICVFSLAAAACGDSSDDDASPTTTGAGAAATTASTTLAPKTGGSITMGMYSETAGLDPVVSNGGGTTGNTELMAIYDTIMRYDTVAGKYEPQTAESLTPNADNSEWTLKLKAGIKFTDGTDYDAEAVAYGLKRHVTFGGRSSSLVNNIKTYTVVDKVTLKFTLNAPWGNFPYLLAYMPGMIPSPTAIKAACGATDDYKPNTCTFNTKPVGAGAFKVDSYRPKESINLVRNDAYYGGKPYLDSLKFVVLLGAQATYDAIKTGTLQVGFLREAAVVKAAREANVDGYLNLVWLGGVLLLNNGQIICRGGLPAASCAGKPDGVISVDTITSDRRVRQAIGYAIDVNIINERANQGASFPGTELFQKDSKWASPGPTTTPDLAKAKALVDQVKAEGKWDGTVRFNCHNAPARVAFAQTVSTLLTQAGFKVVLNNSQDVNALVAQVSNTKAFDVACWGLSTFEEAPDIAMGLSFQSTNPGQTMNIPDLFDAQVKIVREAKTDAERKAAIDKIHEIWKTEVPSIVYEATPEFIAWAKNVHGIRPTVSTSMMFDKAWIE
ncbi:MAG TPA: ABC transporter substrate-binding protein [Acidimicrobiales bacterium]|nr:ABC transporter substrate-binding protein [Acidimicrobiales bacterium]